MTTATAKNRRHAADTALHVWNRTARGVYENFDGWVITKTGNGYSVTRPDGTDLLPGYVWTTLHEAKHQATRNA